MTRRGRAGALTVLLLALLTLTTAVVPAPASADAGAESDFVGRINEARTSRGIAPLRTDGELTSIARRWSQRMADDQRLSHNPNLSKEVTQDWEKLAENVGFGGDVATIHDAFMKSASHRANILDGALTHVGVGVVVDGSGQLWVTEVFMRLRQRGTVATTTTTAAPPAPAPAPTAAPTTVRPRPAPAAAAPSTTSPPTTAAPVPAPETTTVAPVVDDAAAARAEPTSRLVLVLDRLVALDRRR